MGGRASLQAASNFFKMAGDSTLESKGEVLKSLERACGEVAQRQKIVSEWQSNAVAGDAAFQVARAKLAEGDIAGANSASASAAGFYEAAGDLGHEKSAQLQLLDEAILQIAVTKQAVIEEEKRKRAAQDEARRQAVKKAEEEVEMWKERAAQERAKAQDAK